MTVSIVDSGVYCENATDELPVLKQLVKESVGRDVRRIGRFIQLALIGAGRAATDLPANSAVYLSSGRGDMGAMVEVLDSIYRDRQSPRPLSFINTVSNAACFYVAQAMGTEGASSFIGNRYFALEMALKSALLDLETNRIDSALVGAVDMVVAPAAVHRERLGLPAAALMAEGSHWLQLQRDPGDRPVLATLTDIATFPDREALQHWLSDGLDGSEWTLATGQYLAPEEAAQWQVDTGFSALDYRADIGHFDSQAGRALCRFLEDGSGGLVYLNRDPRGRYVAVILKK